MYKTKQEIEQWLWEMDIKNYTINQDLTVDVDGTVDISKRKLTEIPVQFDIVKGSFWCFNNNLTSLEGCPFEVQGEFSCVGNNLTSLYGCPYEVAWDFRCDDSRKKDPEYQVWLLRRKMLEVQN